MIAKKQLRIVQEKEKLTKEIEEVGLWMNRADVERGLSNVTKKSEKSQVLKLQINFRRKVLNQAHPDNSVFKFSQNRKQYGVEKLKQNLFQLLVDSPDENDTPLSSQSSEYFLTQPERLVGERIRHQFVDDEGNSVWYEGTVLQFNANSHEFEVIYDGEDDACWFALLEDLSVGDLFVISV